MDNFCCSHSAQLTFRNQIECIHSLPQSSRESHTHIHTHAHMLCTHVYAHNMQRVTIPPSPPPYIGALLAYIALKDVFSPLVYGICFGLISGMMVYIALTELLPTAYKFHNSSEAFIPTFLVTGMLVMAASLLLFTYA